MSGLPDGATVGTCSNDGCGGTVYIGPSGAETHTSNQACPVTGQWATVPALDRIRDGAR